MDLVFRIEKRSDYRLSMTHYASDDFDLTLTHAAGGDVEVVFETLEDLEAFPEVLATFIQAFIDAGGPTRYADPNEA